MALPAELSRRFIFMLATALVALAMVPGLAHAASLHVVFPQTAEVTVVQGESTNFTLEVQAYGATRCSATTAPVRIDTLYSVNNAGDVAPGLPADMPIVTADQRGTSDNCYIKTPVVIPLTATVGAETPVGDYHSVIRYGKGGDGGVDLDGPALTIHVIAPDAQPVVVLPTPKLAPPPEIIVLGVREAPKPQLGKSVQLTLVKGTVVYREPGKSAKRLLKSVIAANGTKVDTSDGVVKVTVVRDTTGALDTADVWDGGFVVVQSLPAGEKPLTTFTLSGDVKISRNVASAARSSRKRASLWVNAKGNFKTRGKRASAITRGTYWHIQETDQGTRVSVKRGLVAVRDFVRNRTILVPRGHTYLAPNSLPHIRRPVFTGSV